MCLIGLAIDAHPRFAFVIAANRDEFFERPTASLDWWRSADDTPWLLGGRDLAAGGTWMALSATGRIGMLTNVRDPARHRADAASRGALVTAWLDHGRWSALPAATNPFNLIGADLHRRRWWWTSDRHAEPTALAAGVHAVSNGALDEPWPKVQRLSTQLRVALDTTQDDALLQRLFTLLDDDQAAPDDALPDTGIGLARERRLSPAFIRWPEAGYGTRCSTVILGELAGRGRWRIQMHERSHGPDGRATSMRSVTLDDWPDHEGRAPIDERSLS